MAMAIFQSTGLLTNTPQGFDVTASDELGNAVHISGIKKVQGVVRFWGQCRNTQMIDAVTTTIVKDDASGIQALLSGPLVSNDSDIHGKSFWIKFDPASSSVSIFNGNLASV